MTIFIQCCIWVLAGGLAVVLLTIGRICTIEMVEVSLMRIIDCDDALIANPIRRKDSFISLEDSAPKLHHQLNIKGDVHGFSGSCSRELSRICIPRRHGDKVVVVPST